MVLPILDVVAGGAGRQGASQTVGAGVVVGSIPLQGDVVLIGVAQKAIDPGVELDDEAGVEGGWIERSAGVIAIAHVAAVGCGRGVGAELMEDEGDAIRSAVVGSQIDAELDAEGQADVDLVDVPCGSLLTVGGGGELHAIVAQCGCTARDVELRQTRGAGEQQEEEQDSRHADAK